MKPKHIPDDSKKPESPSVKKEMIILAGALLMILGIYFIYGAPLETLNPPPPAYLPITTYDEMPAPCTFIDTRSNASFTNSSVGGSINIMWGCKACVREKLIPLDTDKTYILYGIYSIYMAEFMHDEGFKHLYVLTDYSRWTGSE